MIEITLADTPEKMSGVDLLNTVVSLSAIIARRTREGKPVFDQMMEREVLRKELYRRSTLILT